MGSQIVSLGMRGGGYLMDKLVMVVNRIYCGQSSRGVTQRGQPLLGSGNRTQQLSCRTRLRLKDQVNIKAVDGLVIFTVF